MNEIEITSDRKTWLLSTLEGYPAWYTDAERIAEARARGILSVDESIELAVLQGVNPNELGAAWAAMNHKGGIR